MKTTILPLLLASGVLGSETRVLSDFDRLRIEGALTVVVVVGEEPSVELSGDANLLAFVETEIVDDELRIGLADGSYDFEEPLIARIGVPALDDVEVLAAASIDLDGLSGDFDIELDAAADFSGVTADDVEVEINGTGVVRVHAVESIEVEINGTGTVLYSGDPSRHAFDVHGVGQVRRVDAATDV